jgi:hypothetical protein
MTHYSLHSEIGFFILVLLGGLALYADMLNPFGRMNRVKRPFQTTAEEGGIVLTQRFTLKVRKSFFWKLFAYYKCAWHIVSNLRAGKKAKNKTLDAIIGDIHRLRFDPHKPYLISGDHFNVLYPRNLGIFYHSTLDAGTAQSETDWSHRQRIYLQTVAYALEAFGAYGDCTTTIVPVGPKEVSCVNIYRYPSDSLYGILYGLAALAGGTGPYARYFPAEMAFRLNTIPATQKLLEQHHASITHLLERYCSHVYDAASGLIRKDIAIASAKDSVLRESSFYDNVIFWKTCSLAAQLGLPVPGDIDLGALKSRILETFWAERPGHFLDDASHKARAGAYYSADWLAAFFTGFLDAENPAERRYLEKAAAYTIEKKLDMPFPLRYQESDRPRDEVFLVRFIVPAYGGSAIWSFWGAEFIKLLIVLSRFEGCGQYLERAQKHIAAYERLIVKYKGYPEVYDRRGAMLRSPLYRSVRQTGWVVGFEQAQRFFTIASAARSTPLPREPR